MVIIDADRAGAVGVVEGAEGVLYILYDRLLDLARRHIGAEQSTLDHSRLGVTGDVQLSGDSLHIIARQRVPVGEA